MVVDHTFYTFFFIVTSNNFFIRYHFESLFTIDKVHHLNKLEGDKGLFVLKRT